MDTDTHSLIRSHLDSITNGRVDKYYEMFATPFYSFFIPNFFFSVIYQPISKTHSHVQLNPEFAVCFRIDFILFVFLSLLFLFSSKRYHREFIANITTSLSYVIEMLHFYNCLLTAFQTKISRFFALILSKHWFLYDFFLNIN